MNEHTSAQAAENSASAAKNAARNAVDAAKEAGEHAAKAGEHLVEQVKAGKASAIGFVFIAVVIGALVVYALMHGH